MNNWQDNLEEQSRKFLSISKEQIDYYLIHKEFSYIKKRSLSTVIAINPSIWKMRRRTLISIS